MARKTKKAGRKKGSSNKAGFYFLDTTTRHGWYTTVAGRIVRLLDAAGIHIRDRKAVGEAQAAYARLLTAQPATGASQGDSMLVADVVRNYLDSLKTESTIKGRRASLFDFVTGFPGRFATNGKTPKPTDRIHRGYGDLMIKDVIPNHLRLWVDAHKGWAATGGARTGLQAVRRAFNFAVEMGLIAANPVKGYKVARAKKKTTYFTLEQEQALLRYSKPDFALALRVLIRTGARYGCEFAKLEHRHVKETPQGMRWVFPAEETKTRKEERTIPVASEIAEFTRQQMRKHPKGRVFRNSKGKPWTVEALKTRFDALRDRLERKGIELDAEATLYSARHTYAKRMLAGHWTPEPATIEYLCKWMGNSRDVCWEHYGKWTSTVEDRTARFFA